MAEFSLDEIKKSVAPCEVFAEKPEPIVFETVVDDANYKVTVSEDGVEFDETGDWFPHEFIKRFAKWYLGQSES